MRTVLYVGFRASAIESTHDKVLICATAKEAIAFVVFSGPRKTQHFAHNMCVIYIPGTTIITTSSITERATLVKNLAPITKGSRAFQCYYAVVFVVPIMQPTFKLCVFTVGITFYFFLYCK